MTSRRKFLKLIGTQGWLFGGHTSGVYAKLGVKLYRETRYGYIDTTGNAVIAPNFSNAYDFHEGLAHVKLNSGDPYFVYIDRSGGIALDGQFTSAGQFSDGLAYVRTEDNHGYIDKTGKFVFLVPSELCTYQFIDGVATVKNRDSKYGFIDRNGDILIEPSFDAIAEPHIGCGLAAVKKDGLWGYVDRSGKVRIPFQYNEAEAFREGFARVRQEHVRHFIDLNGRSLDICCYPVGPFSEGLAVVRIGNKHGYIGTCGKIVIDPIYDSASDFSEGLAKVSTNAADFFGYIDPNGKMHIILSSRIYYYTGAFHEGLTDVWEESGGNGFIDKTGQLVIKTFYDDIAEFSEGRALFGLW